MDQSRLGFITSNLLLAFHGFSAEARTRLLGLISTCEGIGWATGVGGDFDYEVSYLARTVQDLGSFGRSFPGDFGIRVSRREMAIEYAQTFFGVRFRDEQDLEGGFTLCKAENAITLNPTDQRIVCAVTHGHGVSLREIAQACGLPQTTVQYRMKRLEEEGVIRSPVYSVKLSKLGLARHHVLLTVSNSSKSLHESLFDFCSRKAGVYALIASMGAWDYKIVTTTSDPDSLQDLLAELRSRFHESIGSLRVLPCLDIARFQYFPVKRDEQHKAANE